MLALVRGRDSGTPPAAFDLQVYRDQLKEVDRDVARGVLPEAEAERIRTEVSRRILAADTAMQQAAAIGAQSAGATRAAVLGTALILIAGSLVLYFGLPGIGGLGAPGYGDLGLQNRIERAEARHSDRPDQAAAEMALTPEDEGIRFDR